MTLHLGAGSPGAAGMLLRRPPGNTFLVGDVRQRPNGSSPMGALPRLG